MVVEFSLPAQTTLAAGMYSMTCRFDQAGTQVSLSTQAKNTLFLFDMVTVLSSDIDIDRQTLQAGGTVSDKCFSVMTLRHLQGERG